jgi:hypothetical protein
MLGGKKQFTWLIDGIPGAAGWTSVNQSGDPLLSRYQGDIAFHVESMGVLSYQKVCPRRIRPVCCLCRPGRESICSWRRTTRWLEDWS